MATPGLRQTPPRPADARRCAVELLGAVLEQARPLDESLAAHPDLPRLSARDRAFCRTLVATTLRHLGEIDAQLTACLERPLPASAAVVMQVLRLGVAQLRLLQTPPHAAVNTSVAITEDLGQVRFKKLVNGVLRRLVREAETATTPPDAATIAARNTPEWLWHSWCAAYGFERASAIAAIHGADPPLDLTLKDPQTTAHWASRLGATVLPWGSLRLAKAGRVDQLPGYDEGAWWVQDAAAALPVRLLGPLADKTVIDLCAAPGGKTAQLAAQGARVTAVDRAAARIARLRDNLQRLQLSAQLVTHDATRWHPGQQVDAVVVDAPCSATGTLRRHPDVAYLKRPQDLPTLVATQRQILGAASRLLRPGGLLVYCVCSLQPEEGPEVVEAVLADSPDLRRQPLTAAELGGHEMLLSAAGDLRTLPCHFAELGGLDGFYAARLLKN